MRKFLLPSLAIFLFIACKKHEGQTKIDICHYDSKTGSSHTITINANAWPAHQAHGDLPGNCAEVTTTICNQTWMAKNLDIDRYKNGDLIPQVTDPAQWAGLTTGAWCYYFNDAANGPVYGKLYNWYAVNDPRGLAPAGWHIPSEAEWTILINCLGGEFVAGGKLKETATAHWLNPNTDASNEAGFTALPGNSRMGTGEFSPSSATPFLGVMGSWWTTTEYDVNHATFAFFKYIANFSGSVQNGADAKTSGFSVRCVRN